MAKAPDAQAVATLNDGPLNPRSELTKTAGLVSTSYEKLNFFWVESQKTSSSPTAEFPQPVMVAVRLPSNSSKSNFPSFTACLALRIERRPARGTCR